MPNLPIPLSGSLINEIDDQTNKGNLTLYEQMLIKSQPDKNTGALFNSNETTKKRFTAQNDLETIEDEGCDDGRTTSHPSSVLKPSRSSVKQTSYPYSGQSFKSGMELDRLN